MERGIKRNRTPSVTADIQQAFKLFDTDKDNTITRREAMHTLHALGLQNDTRKLLQILDPKQKGLITYDRFVTIVEKRMTQIDPRIMAQDAFRLFDIDGSGYITVGNLIHVCKQLQINIPPEYLKSMIEEFGDQHGVNETCFVEIMTQFH